MGQQRRSASGTVQVNVNAAGDLSDTTFFLTSINADVSAHALRIDSQSYGDLEAAARTNGQTTTYDLTSDFAGSTVRLNGNTQLVRDYPTTADATLANLPIDKALAAAKRTDVPARGSLSGTVHLTGTVSDPHAEANLDLVRAPSFTMNRSTNCGCGPRISPAASTYRSLRLPPGLRESK